MKLTAHMEHDSGIMSLNSPGGWQHPAVGRGERFVTRLSVHRTCEQTSTCPSLDTFVAATVSANVVAVATNTDISSVCVEGTFLI